MNNTMADQRSAPTLNQGGIWDHKVKSHPETSALQVALRGFLWSAFLFLSNISFYFVAIIALDLIFWNWRRLGLQKVLFIASAIAFILALTVVLSYLRGPLQTDILMLATAVTLAAILALLSGANSGVRLLASLRIAFVLFLTVNVALYFAGIESYEVGQRAPPSVTLQLFGIEANRAFFYFSRGANAFGAVAGIMTVFLIADYSTSKNRLALLGVIVGLAAVILADTRGALLGILVIGFLTIFRRPTPNAAWVSAALIPSAFFLVQLDWLANISADGLIRTGSDISSGRIFYWSEIIQRLNADYLYWLFGAGIDGTNQIGMRVQQVDNFLDLYSGMKRLPDAHNMLIDLIVTGGLLKASFYCYLLISTIYLLAISRDRRIASYYVVPIFMIFAGIFESVLSYGRLEVVVVIFLIIGVSRRHDTA